VAGINKFAKGIEHRLPISLKWSGWSFWKAAVLQMLNWNCCISWSLRSY